MKFIEFNKELCDNCYKCLRVCPSKCISFSQNDRNIVDDMCIKCGICQQNCPQHALIIRSPIDQVISFIKGENKTAVSIAPSYISAFNMKESKGISSALKKLGFDIVEETSVGAEIVSKKYESLLDSLDTDNIITSCCPSANYLIETQYPNLVEYILPVVSPMMAHGRYIKKRHGDKTKVVFIGPCLAKMAEAHEEEKTIDAVITFRDLEKWILDCGIDLYEETEDCFDLKGSLRGKAYPLYNKNFNSKGKYRHLRVDSVENCKQVLSELEDGVLTGYAIDISICSGSCVNGPEMPENGVGRFQREMRLQKFVNKKEIEGSKLKIEDETVFTDKTFNKRQTSLKKPSEKEIREILISSGKYTIKDELNCGACGYSNCREKAKAVFNGWSDAKDCLPYLREKAENKHSLIIDNSPIAICIVDSQLCVTECNPSFMEIFNKKNIKIDGVPIRYFLEDSLIKNVKETKKSIIGMRLYDKELNKVFIANIIYNEKDHIIFVFLNDISSTEKKKQELEKVKRETLKKTQEVIDKQMRVAQEIAGLLGETTAETKINLNSLKRLVLEDI